MHVLERGFVLCSEGGNGDIEDLLKKKKHNNHQITDSAPSPGINLPVERSTLGPDGISIPWQLGGRETALILEPGGSEGAWPAWGCAAGCPDGNWSLRVPPGLLPFSLHMKLGWERGNWGGGG